MRLVHPPEPHPGTARFRVGFHVVLSVIVARFYATVFGNRSVIEEV